MHLSTSRKRTDGAVGVLDQELARAANLHLSFEARDGDPRTRTLGGSGSDVIRRSVGVDESTRSSIKDLYNNISGVGEWR